MAHRLRKQIIIALVYFLIVVGVLALLFWPQTPAPSCHDGVKNQDETGVDCGGVCGPCIVLPKDLIVTSSSFTRSENGTYDAVFTVKNPNSEYGLKNIAYGINLKDASGDSVAQKDGVAYFLPLQTRPVIEQNIAAVVSSKPLSASITFKNPEWVSITDHFSQVGLTVESPTFAYGNWTNEAASVIAVVRNDSAFTYDSIDVFVVVKNQDGTTVGIRRSAMRTLTAGERREFKVAWRPPFSVSGTPQVEVYATTNVFDNENFVKTHGVIEQFQRLR